MVTGNLKREREGLVKRGRARRGGLFLWVPAFAGDDISYVAAAGRYGPCLIAQVTLAETDSISSPGAIEVEVMAIGAADFERNTGCGAPPSEMLKGAPSVTPAALA